MCFRLGVRMPNQTIAQFQKFVCVCSQKFRSHRKIFVLVVNHRHALAVQMDGDIKNIYSVRFDFLELHFGALSGVAFPRSIAGAVGAVCTIPKDTVNP